MRKFQRVGGNIVESLGLGIEEIFWNTNYIYNVIAEDCEIKVKIGEH